MNRVDMYWFSVFFSAGVISILVGFALWYPLLLMQIPSLSQAESLRFWGPSLFGGGFGFMTIAWFVASGKSGRVLLICFALGIISLLVSTILSMDSMIGMGVYSLVWPIGYSLIFGSFLASFFRPSKNKTVSPYKAEKR